ncbi:MAG: hypothetical protein WAM86_08990 [Candidatus Sulfotelmatobacter sp.]
MERTISLFGAKAVLDVSCFLKRCFLNGRSVAPWRRSLPRRCAALALLAFSVSSVLAETCTTSSDMDDATRTALTAAGLRYFDFVAKGDAASLRQGAIASLAADFSGIEASVKDNQPALAGSKGSARPPFLLEGESSAPIARAEFFCGVFGSKGQTRNSAVFSLNNLPPGKYGVVILDATSPKGAYTVSLILQQQSSDWKLGGLYIKAAQSGGHDSDWFAAHASAFQNKGQIHNAWLYYLEAISLVSPLPFMSTAASDKLYDESQKLQPADFPAEGKTVDLSAGNPAGTSVGTSSYKLSAIFPQVVGDDLDLVVRYQAADVSNTTLAYQNNVAVMKSLVAKYPELRDAFTGVVARAVDPNGRDYGTLLAMKEIK